MKKTLFLTLTILTMFCVIRAHGQDQYKREAERRFNDSQNRANQSQRAFWDFYYRDFGSNNSSSNNSSTDITFTTLKKMLSDPETIQLIRDSDSIDWLKEYIKKYYSSNSTELLQLLEKNLKELEPKHITIPDGVTSIKNYEYRDKRLISVTIPDSVTIIGAGAFASNSLTSITIPDSVTGIGGEAFYSNSLKSIIIPNSVTYIGKDAFKHNFLLFDITMPANVNAHIEAFPNDFIRSYIL